MNLRTMAEVLELETLVAPHNPERVITGGYASDLLSCVMAGASAGNIWITVQTHPNIIAVASLLDLAGIVLTETRSTEHIDRATIQKAISEGVALYATSLPTYTLIIRFASSNVPGVDM